ncbi:MAG: hypothetical protein ACI8ZB_000569 [Desulforhopalus sp.]|jgi:hypothetical protein
MAQNAAKQQVVAGLQIDAVTLNGATTPDKPETLIAIFMVGFAPSPAQDLVLIAESMASKELLVIDVALALAPF